MTGEEMERAIEFLLQGQANFDTRLEHLLQNQANFDARLEQTNLQVAETSRQLQAYAETQTEFIQIVTRHIEAQVEINASLRESIRELKASRREFAESQRELTASQRTLTASQLRTDERLDRLADTVERYISERRNGNSQQ